MLKYIAVFCAGFGIAFLVPRGSSTEESRTSVAVNAGSAVEVTTTNAGAGVQVNIGKDSDKKVDKNTKTEKSGSKVSSFSVGSFEYKGKTAAVLSQYPAERREAVALLKPADIALWKDMRQQKLDSVVSGGKEFWSNGWGNGIQSRFDTTSFNSLAGEYSARFKYTDPDDKSEVTGSLQLSLVALDDKIRKNRLIVHAPHGGVNQKFNAELIGSESNLLNVVWRNPKVFEGAGYSYFAFKMPTTFRPLSTTSQELFGLDESFEWQRIGSMTLVRSK